MRFEIYSRRTIKGRRWYWRLRAANREIIASGEGYNHRAGALCAIDLVRATGTLTPMVERV